MTNTEARVFFERAAFEAEMDELKAKTDEQMFNARQRWREAQYMILMSNH